MHEEFTKPKYVYKMELDRVIDGDTIVAILDVGFHTYMKKHIRFLGFDTYQLWGGTGDSKEKAQQATDRLKDLLNGKQLYIMTQLDETGKYGRTLGRLFAEDEKGIIDVIQTMIDEGYDKRDDKEILNEERPHYIQLTE